MGKGEGKKIMREEREENIYSKEIQEERRKMKKNKTE